MDALEFFARVGIYLTVLTFSCVLHECSHVFVALKLGDTTGKDAGRLTLNPVPHFDFFWTFLIPMLGYVTGGAIIGGPKPAPVNPLRFRNPRLGFMLTALAGPLLNLSLATMGVLLLWLTFRFPGIAPPDSWNAIFLMEVVVTNLCLTAFNLLPLPPLDGSRFLSYMLGDRADRVMFFMERFSILMLLFAVYFVWPQVWRTVFYGLQLLLVNLFNTEYASALLYAYFRL